jgi:hypothetical protein
VACIAEILFLDGLTSGERTKLFFLYVPYVVIPLGIAIDFYNRISLWVPKEKLKGG